LNNATNLTVERYIPANGRRYRFLASPVVGGTTLQWRDNGGSTSGRGIQITGPTGTVDASTNNAKSAFYYLETNTTGTINDAAKWPSIDGSTTLTNGQGYRVFVRGDRTISLTTLNTVNNATTIWVNGTYPSGTRTLPVTYTNVTGGGQGWNLVGNPYPCSIDWMSASGWTKTNVGTGVAIWRPSTNSYAYSLASSDASDNVNVSVNGGGTVIGSGQGFFVRATGTSPALSCTENVKVLTAPTTLLLKTVPSNQLRIKLTQDTSNIDETLIVFGPKFQDEFVESEDFSKIPNPTVNISSVLGTEQYAAINFTSNNYAEKTIPLSVWGNSNGTYQLDLTQVSGFDAAVSIYLRDKYLNTTTAIDHDKNIPVIITDDSLSKGDKRFELLFKNTATINNELTNNISNTQLSVYPNPAVDVLNISLSHGTAIETVNIYNVSGKLLNFTKLNVNQIDISQLNNGVYMLEAITANGTFKAKFVK
ncbi:MAG: T9SS type A sorting domain-containing protein, partial [Bacteroidia bacterium]|nr:T9SS type A sorting domain-containing protein [Bacteroidia bacterium]